MAYTIVVEVPITVLDDAQAEKIIEAVQSGLAEIAIKDRVLYGGTFMAPAPQQTFASEKKKSEASQALKPVAVRTPKREVTTQIDTTPKERPRGVIGHKKMSRTGRT